ncbi:MAG: hypothetical protein ACTHMY_31475 [Solirubrobacteraceae bacterium]
MNPAACSLDTDELAAQLERYHEIGRLAAGVEHESGRVVVWFVDDPPRALIARALEVERGCCSFFEIDYDPVTQRLAISADHPDHRPGVDAIASALTESRAMGLPPDGGRGNVPAVPDVASCCSPAALETCCEPQDKQDCCGQPSSAGTTTAAPSRCGCRE